MSFIFRQYLKMIVLFSLCLFNSSAYSSNSAAKEQTLQIASGSAMVVDLANGQVLYAMKPRRVRPIASITKLMTVMVALDAHQPPDELLKVDISHDPDMHGVYSRVKIGSMLSRKQLMLLALMSSENRAAATLANHYKGGYYAFINAMNAKAKALGMRNTFYVEPTGISQRNISTAIDLTLLLKAVAKYPQLMAMSTTKGTTAVFRKPHYSLPFRNTNHLIYSKKWKIDLTKTGFTNEAGHCLVMRTWINSRPVALIVLDAFGKYTHFADANRIRHWLETGKVSKVPAAAMMYRKFKQNPSD